MVPQFQREYAWDTDDVEEFWNDLRRGLEEDAYFLGLIILTGEDARKDVVDGQQRLLTLTLLAAALYHEALQADRRALAERIQSTFLRSIDFDSDEELPRLKLSADADDSTLRSILEHSADELGAVNYDDKSVSGHLLSAYRRISRRLSDDLQSDPFKRLGIWADFLTNRLYLATFVHPNPSSAYKVFEVVNTRGKELTTADLLKSFVLSQTAEGKRQARYEEWQRMVGSFSGDNQGQIVQFIRHAVTVRHGYVPPKDLYDVLSGGARTRRPRISPEELMNLLEDSLPSYLQMIDPAVEGPAGIEHLGIFSALNRLGVISVRPILLAMLNTENALVGMRELLKFVVRRVVVGNLGTGSVERRLGQAAYTIQNSGGWEETLNDLSDLNPPRDDFQSQLHRRSLNKNVLTFMRQSILQGSITPNPNGFMHLIRPRSADWPEFSEERSTYWGSTIGNTFLSTDERRPKGAGTWEGFKDKLLPSAVDEEWVERIKRVDVWNEDAVDGIGMELADKASSVWYE